MSATLDDARQSLVTNFRSIYVLTTRDEESARMSPSLDEVGRWLWEFNAAYLDANQAVNEGRLHAFSGRRLVLVGDHLLPEFASVARLYEVARQCGMAVTLSLTLDGLLRHALALATLRSAHPALQLQIDCSALDTESSPDRRTACAAALRDLAQTGVELNLIGSIGQLRAAGLTSSPELNRSGFSVSAMTTGVRPVHRLHHVSPCRDFIALYIDPSDDIYPCAGMVGHAPSRLGSLNAPFSELLQALAQTRRSFDTLSPLGPRISPRVAEQIDHYPVDLCSLHRLGVASLAAL